jgi:hypothetical protein
MPLKRLTISLTWEITMSEYSLRLTLLRDTTFGRGDGVAGYVDTEVDYDDYGLPILRGRALKGMLVYECADILFALKQQLKLTESWLQAARFLFGEPGSQLEGRAQMSIGNACLPSDLRQAIAYQMDLHRRATPKKVGQLTLEVLNALTTVRRQTAVETDGVAKEHSLRAVRLIQRQIEFEAALTFMSTVEDIYAKALLAACVKSFRRGGTGRHRGPGLLESRLYQDGVEITAEWFELFRQEIDQ